MGSMSDIRKDITARLGAIDSIGDRPGAKAKMAKWTVTPTKKHGKDIEEHTAKIGRDHWKIDSMPHLGKSVGSLYRWDEMRGLRHISTGNIEQLKRQAEAISTKQDALSDVMRGFSRPGAKAEMAMDSEGRRLIPFLQNAMSFASDGDFKMAKRYAKRFVEEATAAGFSRPGAKAKMEISASEARKIIATIEERRSTATEWSPALDHLTKQRTFAQRLIAAHEQGDSANIARYSQLLEKAGWSRPGAKVTAGRAEDLYRKLSSGSITYANAKEWERLVTEALRLPDYTPPGGDMSLHEIAEDLGGDLMALKTHSGPVPHAKAKAEKASDLEREDVKAGLKVMAASDPAVSDKIRTLIAEGKPQDQAVAIALDMKRRGEL